MLVFPGVLSLLASPHRGSFGKNPPGDYMWLLHWPNVDPHIVTGGVLSLAQCRPTVTGGFSHWPNVDPHVATGGVFHWPSHRGGFRRPGVVLDAPGSAILENQDKTKKSLDVLYSFLDF